LEGFKVTKVAQALKRLLNGDELLMVPTCFDALSARLAYEAGFPVGFMSGAAVSATRLGMPDTGLIGLVELSDQLRNICSAIPGQPVIGDGDTGFGNEMNVRRTVQEYARAGAACVMIEDQVFPKRCGHFEGKQVIPRDQARMKIRAAVDAAREEGILVLARTDARAIEGFDAAVQRCRDFEEEGAYIVFLEAPLTEQELADFASAMRQPAMANIVEGGKTPMLSTAKLKELGFRLAIYHPMLFSAIQAMQDSLIALRSDGLVTPPKTSGFEEFKRLAGLPQYDAISEKYSQTSLKKTG
jgi:2-methylisocitrate lyase-like PEP mutase family enzyme